MLIAQLTDLHIRPVGMAADRVSETNMLTDRAFRAVMALDPRPDVVLITGDLTECGRADEYAVFKKLVAHHMRVPVFFIPGNHDRRDVLIEQVPETRHNEGFVQFAVDDFPVRFVMLDTVVPGAGHGELCTRRLDWLDRTLSERPDRPTLIGMHHPPFTTGIAHMDRIDLQNRSAFHEILARHRQVSLILCGHVHRPIIATVGSALVCCGPSVAHQVELNLHPEGPSQFRLEPPAYLLHRFSRESGFVTHMAYVESFPGPFPFLTEPDYPGKPS